jgi:hypothetical protein
LISPEQTVQDGEELPLYVPAAHMVQVEEDPVSPLYFPASQLWEEQNDLELGG